MMRTESGSSRCRPVKPETNGRQTDVSGVGHLNTSANIFTQLNPSNEDFISCMFIHLNQTSKSHYGGIANNRCLQSEADTPADVSVCRRELLRPVVM